MGKQLKRIKDVFINKDYIPGKPENKSYDEFLKKLLSGQIQASIKKSKKKKTT